MKKIESYGLADPLGSDRQAKIQTWLEEAEQIIGPEWLRRQKETNSFCGMTIADLANYCGMLDLYATIYGGLCHRSHASDAQEFVSLSLDPNEASAEALVGPDTSAFSTVFVVGTGLFGILLEDLNSEFKLGHDAQQEQLCQRLHAVEPSIGEGGNAGE